MRRPVPNSNKSGKSYTEYVQRKVEDKAVKKAKASTAAKQAEFKRTPPRKPLNVPMKTPALKAAGRIAGPLAAAAITGYEIGTAFTKTKPGQKAVAKTSEAIEVAAKGSKKQTKPVPVKTRSEPAVKRKK